VDNKPALFIKISSHSDRNILEAGKGLYDGIFLDASFSGLSDNTLGILKKKFIIEPKSYIFALDTKYVEDSTTGYPKESLFNMSKIYGSPISNLFNHRPINCQDFRNPNSISGLTRNVLEFQRVKLSRQELLFDDDYYDKYRDGPDEKLEKKLLFCLIPPYFFPNNHNNGIQGLNLQFVDLAMKEKKDDEKVFAVIPLNCSFFRNGNSIEKLCDDYLSIDPDGFFLFLNQFSERNASIEILRAIISMVKLLSSSKKPIFKLFGGYFSTLLSQIGLSGFTCGLGHGESRNIFAIYKGSPPQLYYVPFLHKNFLLKEVPTILRRFSEFECRCPECRDTDGLGFYDDEIRRKRHYLLARKEEIDRLSKFGLGKAVEDMESIFAKYKNRGLGIDYLERWSRVLS
jgi:hypothetical protein